jgi:hypothetical protein
MTMAALAQVVADSLTGQKLPDNWLPHRPAANKQMSVVAHYADA